MPAKVTLACLVAACFSVEAVDTGIGSSEPATAAGGDAPCEVFGSETRENIGWQFADCLDVWTAWNKSLSGRHDLPNTDVNVRNFFSTVAEQYRAAQFPCEVKSVQWNDGAGSRTMRFLADWIFARNLGCDWMGVGETTNGTKSSELYCHAAARTASDPRGISPEDESARCTHVNWLKFFNLEKNIAKSNTSGPTRNVHVSTIHLRVYGVTYVYTCHGIFRAEPDFARQPCLCFGSHEHSKKQV